MGAPVGNTNAKRGLGIRAEFERFASENPEKIQQIIVRLYEIAANGGPRDCIAAAQVIFDRTEGKAQQSVQLANEGDGTFRITWPLPQTTLDR